MFSWRIAGGVGSLMGEAVLRIEGWDEVSLEYMMLLVEVSLLEVVVGVGVVSVLVGVLPFR